MVHAPITILGAGLGGLTLSRSLGQRGISSVVYDRASTSPRHKYGITLYSWAYNPLLHVLGMDEAAFRRRVAVDSAQPMGMGRVSRCEASESAPIRANLSKLESLLRGGQAVIPEHQLLSARVIEDIHTIELSFRNNLQVRAHLLVDAAGVHSQLRRSLLPHIELEVHPFAVYSGKRYIKPDVFSSFYAGTFRDCNVLVREPQQVGDPRLEVSINDYFEDGSVSISYIYSRVVKGARQDDPLAKLQRSKDEATNIPQAFFAELRHFVANVRPGQPFEDCFDVEKVRSDRVLNWLMRTVIVPKQDLLRLSEYGVVMIGDAAHAVPILGGSGANMAILDAIKLAEALEKGQEASDLKSFCEMNWHSWKITVEDSKRDLTELHNVPQI